MEHPKRENGKKAEKGKKKNVKHDPQAESARAVFGKQNQHNS